MVSTPLKNMRNGDDDFKYMGHMFQTTNQTIFLDSFGCFFIFFWEIFWGCRFSMSRTSQKSQNKNKWHHFAIDFPLFRPPKKKHGHHLGRFLAVAIKVDCWSHCTTNLHVHLWQGRQAIDPNVSGEMNGDPIYGPWLWDKWHKVWHVLTL